MALRVKVVVVPLAGTLIKPSPRLLTRLGSKAAGVAGVAGTLMLRLTCTMSVVGVTKLQEYGIVAVQVAVVPLRVAATEAVSMISVPLPESIKIAWGEQAITSAVGNVELRVMVVVNTSLPVTVVAAAAMSSTVNLAFDFPHAGKAGSEKARHVTNTRAIRLCFIHTPLLRVV